MKHKFYLHSLVAIFVFSANNFVSAGVGELSSTFVSRQAQGVYGLESVPFDRLTRILETKGHSVDFKTYQNSRDTRLLTHLLTVSGKTQIFDELLKSISETVLVTEDDYYRLAQAIAELRDAYREKAHYDQLTELRETLFLLQMVQEEVLYAGYTKFNHPAKGEIIEKSWSWLPRSKFSPMGSEREIPLRGIPVRNGDVILSKATGSGSSSFIALTGNAPHIFSHVTMAVVTDIDGQEKLISPEADIADGVKLRSFEDYREGKKTRLFVYRLRGIDEQKAKDIRTATERFVQKMFAVTPDPFNVKAFNYDFDLNPDTEGAYYCAAIPCRIMRDTPLDEFMNPYPRMLWTQPRGIRRVIYDFLAIPKKPSAAPGDLEANRNYELVGTQIQLHRLEQERVELAILDSMFDLLAQNKDLVEDIVKKIETLGDEPIKPEEIKFLVDNKILPESAISKIPENIKPRQMIFFAYLNEMFTPKIRQVVMERLRQKNESGKLMGLQEMRLIAYRIQEERLGELINGVEFFVGKIKEGKLHSDPVLRCVGALSLNIR